MNWVEVFHDPCTFDWRENWDLDGLKASIEDGPEGRSFAAGSTFGDDSCHAVLWSKRSFSGDVKIEFEYTRLDSTVRAVTILYVHASGSGRAPYDPDIASWRHLREVPTMSLYYDHMQAYHISLAAFDLDNTDPRNDYIRARRYTPETGRALEGTALVPDHFRTGLFQTNVPHRISVTKTIDELTLEIETAEKHLSCRWDTTTLPPIEGGRIGLRHMYTRSARYRDFRVYRHEEINQEDGAAFG